MAMYWDFPTVATTVVWLAEWMAVDWVAKMVAERAHLMVVQTAVS